MNQKDCAHSLERNEKTRGIDCVEARGIVWYKGIYFSGVFEGGILHKKKPNLRG